MFSTDTNIDEWYEQRRVNFESLKETLPKKPTEKESKKEYCILCHTKKDWEHVHEILMQDGTLEDNIPSRTVECPSACNHSELRGIYLLDDDEVEQLKNHPGVANVNINASAYPGTYMDNPDNLVESLTKENRYASNVWCQGYSYVNSYTSSTPGIDLKNRGSMQLLRHVQKKSPWVSGQWETGAGVAGTTGASIQIGSQIPQYGTGKDVDVIVCDQDMWFGHIEFQNTLGISTLTTADTPQNYVGGNKLSNSGISTTVGTCDLLDLVLDAPYYLDPDFFNADPGNRLTTRWDGTTVPTDSAGLNWWRNNSTTYRSPKFVSAGIGTGEAVAGTVEDFGAILANSSYTRSRSNGSNTAYQNNSGFHGTPCASQTYGRQYGWAYNSNKWFLNLYGTYGVLWEVGFDMQKVFHQIKPINSSKGDKDPTISSNSWSNRVGSWSSGYINHRDAAGTGQAPLDGSNAVSYGSQVGPLIGNSGTLAIEYEFDNSIIQSGVELVESGVIFCYAAGNRDQKVVRGDHPDYNNYYTLSDNQTPAEGRRSGYSSMPGIYFQPFYNRIGYPGQIGKRHDTKGVAFYKGIGVGALDEYGTTSSSAGEVGVGTFYRQCKTSYSNMGNGVDIFALCDMSFAACEDNSSGYKRYDRYYDLDGVTSVESEDRLFNGTSSATPIAVGLMATKLEYNRGWNWADMKHWFKTALGGPLLGSTDSAGTSTVYAGIEGDGDYTTSLWTDSYTLQGSDAPVIWDAPTGAEPNLTKLIDGGAQPLTFSGDITIKIVE